MLKQVPKVTQRSAWGGAHRCPEACRAPKLCSSLRPRSHCCRGKNTPRVPDPSLSSAHVSRAAWQGSVLQSFRFPTCHRGAAPEASGSEAPC